MSRSTAIMVTLCLGILTGCMAGPDGGALPPYPPVPPLMADPMPRPPVTAQALVWQAGHWDWTGSDYVWQAGQYVPAAGHGPLWRPGWWNLSAAGWRWEPAQWVGN